MERMVLQVERTLNSVEIKVAYPETGEDIKVMAIRRHEDIELTVSCAFVDRYIADADDYVQKKLQFAKLVEKTAETVSDKNIDVIVNAADELNTGSLVFDGNRHFSRIR